LAGAPKTEAVGAVVVVGAVVDAPPPNKFPFGAGEALPNIPLFTSVDGVVFAGVVG